MVGKLAAAGVVKHRQLVGDGADVLHVGFAHRFDLPLDEMQAAISAGVAAVPLDAAVLRMDVKFDAPLDRRHGEVDVNDAAAHRTDDPRLLLDRNGAQAQRLGEDYLGM